MLTAMSGWICFDYTMQAISYMMMHTISQRSREHDMLVKLLLDNIIALGTREILVCR